MNDYYEDVVWNLYINLRPKFIRVLTAKYPSLRLDEAEDLYQDSFIAVKDNMERGKVRENTSWEAYIIQIGINLTNKYLRKAQITDSMDESEDNGKSNRFASFLNMSTESEEGELQSMEVYAILGNELEHSPSRCHKILRLFYYASLDLTKIAEEVGLKNAGSVKVTKSRCMKDLIGRVKNAVRLSGINI